MNKYLSIGEVSKLKNIPVKTLRFYEQIGLLKPAYVNPENNYRYYSFDQMIYIEYIQFYKSSGASLKEIMEFCKDDDVDRVAVFLEKQLKGVDEQIQHLIECREKFINIRKEILHDALRKDKTDVYYRVLEERTAVSYECRTNPTDENTYRIYAQAFKYIKDNQLFSYYPTGSIVELDEKKNDIIYKRMFIGVNANGKSKTEGLFVIPKGKYLCVNYYKHNKTAQIQKIVREIKSQNLVPKIITEADTFVNITKYDDPMMELQVLIED